MKRSVWFLVATGAVTGACLAAAATAPAAAFTNSAPITINDAAKASPYPSTITVSGLSGPMTDVNVTLNGLTHSFSHDVGVLLVGIGGAKKIVLMADSGSSASGVNLTFDDAAAASLPNSGALVTGTFKPSVNLPGSCPYPSPFPQPAPLGPYGSALSDFTGTNGNGVWYLYVVDDCTGDTGSISGGWTLNIATSLAVAVTSLTARRAQGGVLVRWRTGTEADMLGFNVFRQQGNRRVRVNRRLLPALGQMAGGSYSFVDRRAPKRGAVRYWLQDVSVSGARAWHGPVRVARA